MEKYGFSVDQWERAKQEAKDILIDCAKTQKMISYSDLSSRICSIQIEAHDPRLAHMLGEISREESREGRGMLSVLVVHKYGDQRPGKGFFDLARTLGNHFRNQDEFWSHELSTVLKYWSEMQRDPVTIFVAYENIRPFRAAYDEWIRGFGETNYMYPPQGPGKLVGDKVVGVTFTQVPRAFLKILDAKKIWYEEF